MAEAGEEAGKMAVFGYLDELLPLYKGKDKNIYKGLLYLKNISAKTFKMVRADKPHKDEFCGKKIFAINQCYLPKDHSQAKFEGHEAYIDIQFIFSGCEEIYLVSRCDCQKETVYDKEKDIQFFKSKVWSSIYLKPGMAAIFYRQDIHAPSLNCGIKGIIKKSVVKVTARG